MRTGRTITWIGHSYDGMELLPHFDRLRPTAFHCVAKCKWGWPCCSCLSWTTSTPSPSTASKAIRSKPMVRLLSKEKKGLWYVTSDENLCSNDRQPIVPGSALTLAPKLRPRNPFVSCAQIELEGLPKLRVWMNSCIDPYTQLLRCVGILSSLDWPALFGAKRVKFPVHPITSPPLFTDPNTFNLISSINHHFTYTYFLSPFII